MISVCVFAKPPLPGKVKTRLAAVIGDDAAAELASAMLCDVWDTVTRVRGVVPVLAAACEGAFPIRVDAERSWRQRGTQLGARIESILRRGLVASEAAIALGADSPLLETAHLEAAIKALRAHDAVIGPCTDGGFYLLGIRNCPTGLLHDLPWSSPDTCARTVERLCEHGMSVAQIAELDDVDTIDDLERLQSRFLSGPETLAPCTRQWSASLSRR